MSLFLAILAFSDFLLKRDFALFPHFSAARPGRLMPFGRLSASLYIKVELPAGPLRPPVAPEGGSG